MPGSIVIAIPCYNHGRQLKQTVAGIAELNLPVLIIDDGCTEADRQLIEECRQAFKEQVSVLHHEHNQGKGAAMRTAFAWALEHGFDYVLQLDADGQHDAAALPQLMQALDEHPGALISGLPQYDASMPTSRRIGRWITHVWVWIETLSFEIKDSMCGLRLYPVKPSLQAAEHSGLRMDFDTDIMVHLYWAGIKVIFVPVRVIYPQDGYSNFKAFADNVRISWMHTRLVCRMLLSLPGRLLRALFTSKDAVRRNSR